MSCYPEIVDRETWRAAREELLVREKAHTRAGDALAAARRRLPMVEVDATLPVTGSVASTSTIGSRRLAAAIASPARVCAFSRTSSSSRAARQVSRSTISG